MRRSAQVSYFNRRLSAIIGGMMILIISNKLALVLIRLSYLHCPMLKHRACINHLSLLKALCSSVVYAYDQSLKLLSYTSLLNRV